MPRTLLDTVVDSAGGFAALSALPTDVEEPLLVSGTGAIAERVQIALAVGRHDTVGQDLVATCVNEVITTGARPLFFVDYFACDKLDVAVSERVIAGVAEGCCMAGCTLLGGETAERPGSYPAGEYDLAGFAVGVVGRREVLGKAKVRPGDVLVAIASSGLHARGVAPARRVLEQRLGLSLVQQVPELGRTLADELLTPTRIYAQAAAALLSAIDKDLHALCRVDLGVPASLLNVVPAGLVARVRLDHELPPLLRLLERGRVLGRDELRQTFNLGIGLVAVVQGRALSRALRTLAAAGERAWAMGEVVDGAGGADAPPGVDVVSDA